MREGVLGGEKSDKVGLEVNDVQGGEGDARVGEMSSCTRGKHCLGWAVRYFGRGQCAYIVRREM